MRFILSILATALVVFLLARWMDGVRVEDYQTAIIVSVVLALVNFFVKPVVKILTLPITLLTLGLFLLVINGLMVLLVDYLVAGFSVDGFLRAIIFAVALAVLNTLVSWFLPGKN